MVRLKAVITTKCLCPIPYFNSTMVRLKAGKSIQKDKSELNFNSTMVRLKARHLRQALQV